MRAPARDAREKVAGAHLHLLHLEVQREVRRVRARKLLDLELAEPLLQVQNLPVALPHRLEEHVRGLRLGHPQLRVRLRKLGAGLLEPVPCGFGLAMETRGRPLGLSVPVRVFQAPEGHGAQLLFEILKFGRLRLEIRGKLLDPCLVVAPKMIKLLFFGLQSY